MHFLVDIYLKQYREYIAHLNENIELFKHTSQDQDFKYLTESSSVFSANIEGNSLDLNSFMNFRASVNRTKDVEEIENLIEAYQFAQSNKLTEEHLLETHKLCSWSLLDISLAWVYRNTKVGVFGKGGLIYLAIEPEYVTQTMRELFEDIEQLIQSELSVEEVFYYASFIHLKFVHIHPFADGNGRCARLLEKWFLSEKLGHDFWKLPAEEYYKEHRNVYYANINLGVNYYELDYTKCIPFLLMLSESLKKDK